MVKKRLYIPITRQGKSITSSVITQLMDERRRVRKAAILERLENHELTPFQAWIRIHPIIFIWLLVFLFAIIATLIQGIWGLRNVAYGLINAFQGSAWLNLP